MKQTGEILHGKTSPLKHDGKGVYAGLSQDISVTRYHSLAGTHVTLPECLEISSWTPLGGTENGHVNGDASTVIMGVRHKRNVVEGVQFHPESILTASGREMLQNFLRMQGGTWSENEQLQKRSGAATNGVSPPPKSSSSTAGKKTSILEKIYAQRKLDIAAQREIPSQRPEDLQAAYDMYLSPPIIDFAAR